MRRPFFHSQRSLLRVLLSVAVQAVRVVLDDLHPGVRIGLVYTTYTPSTLPISHPSNPTIMYSERRQYMNSDQRVAIVTGANGAIGKAIAQGIAEQGDFEVILACRDEGRAQRAVQDVIRATGNQNVRYELVDVSRQASIQALAERWQGPLHVLVNNAGATPRRRLETPEGVEMQFATNVLGYFWMIQAFTGHLRRSAPARVVNVASYWAGDLDLNDLEFKTRRYDNGRAYRQSKQANRMLTAAFAQRLEQYDIAVNACHPGDVNSKLSNDLGFGGSESPQAGARTPVWLATDPAGQGYTGNYFDNLRPVRDRFAEDEVAIERLYQACLEYSR
jgi:NAD(P)-dependent dehydrogenase (short-subunit alcohol dehydrogenase family)